MGAYQVLSFAELMQKGEAAPAEPVPPQTSDLCTIMYTSGTTGDPKVGIQYCILYHVCWMCCLSQCAGLDMCSHHCPSCTPW